MKYISLVCLTLQNVTSILLLRYVRTRTGPRFINSTAVVNTEIQKAIFSIVLLFIEERRFKRGFQLIYQKFVKEPKDTLKTGIPALLYVLQNNLLYIAISNLDVATFQISFQLKLLTTALFMVIILNRHLALTQWFSLFLLFIGVSLVQVENMTATKVKPDINPSLAIIAVISACTLSGLAGVYFEKILKSSDTSIWMRNIQMGAYGTVFGLLTMFIYDGEQIMKDGFLYGYTPLVWLAILTQSAGGLLVALVLKHADNILKGFATSLAIIISCAVSMVLFDFQLTILYVLGSSFVIISIFLYSKPDLISCR